MRNVTILAVVAMLALAAPANGDTWDGGGDGSSYHDGLNWGGDVVPSLATTSSAEVWDYSTVTISADIPVGLMHRIAKGNYNLTGGIMSGGYFIFGYYGDYAYTCQLVQTGGLVTISDNEQSGWMNQGVFVGNNARPAAYTISGGAIDLMDDQGSGLRISQAGKWDSSSFTVVGTGPIKIEIGLFDMASSHATLNMVLDAAGAVRVIEATTAVMQGTLNINDDLALGLVMGDTVTVVTTTASLDYSALVFSDPDWTMSTGGSDLVLTYVPEPATLTLLGIGLVGVVLRRKRR